ncbi:hypothetical protein [Rhodococcoides fascians]|nr:hypothetical protein [Rhodococcus fascians]
MHLAPVYTPDPDYIDRQIDAELAAEYDSTHPDSEQRDVERAAS